MGLDTAPTRSVCSVRAVFLSPPLLAARPYAAAMDLVNVGGKNTSAVFIVGCWASDLRVESPLPRPTGKTSIADLRPPRGNQVLRENCRFCAGTASSNSTPPGKKDKIPVPPIWRGIPFSMRRVPKPFLTGGGTVGPPVSTHRSCNDLPSVCIALETSTFPFTRESAPYFVAFVQSSLRRSDIGRIDADPISILSPLYEIRPTAVSCCSVAPRITVAKSAECRSVLSRRSCALDMAINRAPMAASASATLLEARRL